MYYVLITSLILYFSIGLRIAKLYIDTTYEEEEEDGNVYWVWLKCVIFGVPIALLFLYQYRREFFKCIK